MYKARFVILCLVLCVMQFASFNIHAQSIGSSEFQTYRIQHRNFTWKLYEGKQCNMYCEEDTTPLLKIAVEQISDIIQQIEDSLQMQFSDKLNIILFNSQSHRQQSNIGQLVEQLNPGGEVKFNGNRILVIYCGSKEKLLDDLRFELTNYLIEKELYGSNTKEILFNRNKRAFPTWLIQGIIHHLSLQWDSNDDVRLKQFLFTGQIKTFNQLVEYDEVLAGKAFCYFLQQRFGSNSITKLIFQLRSTRNTDKSIRATFKNTNSFLEKSTLAFFAERFTNDMKFQDTLDTKDLIFAKKILIKKASLFENSVKMNCTNSVVFYFEQKENTLKLFAESLSIYAIQLDANEFQLPILVTHPTKPQQCIIIYIAQENIQIHEFVLSKQGEVINHSKHIFTELDGIESACYGNNSNTLFLTGYVNGQTDIYEYNFQKGSLHQITNDNYDESQIAYEDEIGLFYCTNNPTDSINWNNQNGISITQSQLQFINENQIKNLLQQKNKTEIVKSFKLQELEVVKSIKLNLQKDSLLYISNQNGIDNVYKLAFSKLEFNANSLLIALTNTNYSISDFSATSKQIVIANSLMDSIMCCSLNEQNLNKPIQKTLNKQDIEKRIGVHKIQSLDTLKKSTNIFSFFEPDSNEMKQYNVQKKQERIFDINHVKKYQLQLTSEYIGAQIDNSLLINQYQPYAVSKGLFRQSPLGGLMRYSFSDIFENHVVNLGMRIPSTAKGSDFYCNYNNYRKRIDWGIVYFRHTEKFTSVSDSAWRSQSKKYYPPYIKQKVHYLELKATYPFTTKQSISFSIANRYDKYLFIATDTFSLKYPDTLQVWNIVKIEYQIDASKQPILYIREGFRAKAFAEIQNQITEKGEGFIHLGIDVRNYLPIYKHIVWANKMCASFSGGGTNGIMYTLGGTNNWIGARVDSTAIFLPNDNYSFISNANNLRGYAQNIRYGNTFILWNSEIRVPILNTFCNHHFVFNSLNNLQFVPFLDLGNAWKSPLLLNNKIPSWALGYGVGVRTTLAEYFVRLDIAKANSKQAKQRKAMIIVALGREF
jgi:peptide methionine sulfoxide reductase MsrA